MSGRVPWLTLGIAVAAVAVAVVPGLADAVALDLHDPATPWRWWAAHLAHFSGDHLAWDLLVLVVLGTRLERIDRARVGLVYALATPAISLGLAALATSGGGDPSGPSPGAVDSYRGLSGVDAALTGAALVAGWSMAKDRATRGLTAVIGAALVAKIAYEAVTGATVFARTDGWTAVPLAHAIGAGVGAWLWAVAKRVPVPVGAGQRASASDELQTSAS